MYIILFSGNLEAGPLQFFLRSVAGDPLRATEVRRNRNVNYMTTDISKS